MSKRTPLIAAIGMALLAVIVLLVAVLPKNREVAARQMDLEAAQQEEQALNDELERLRDQQAQLPQVKRRLAAFNARVPASADLPGLIRLLQQASDASALDFISIAPASPTPLATGQASIIPVAVVLVGGFFQVDEFLFRLETLPRAAKVMTVGATAGPDGLPQLQVTLTVQVYSTDASVGPGAPPATVPGVPTPTPTGSPTATPTGTPTSTPTSP